ncbi:hypothetical protein QYM36_004649 [Artemia franciscana]|uniref:Uncharacterized protein n=1 Tax=Artemia franciscana TaxID=6661 RepID=A0AA88LC87_ARTSF|nr:hypothetical protein QYM36_004649 [Artemia franciscana]
MSIIKFCAIGIPVSCAGIAITWAIKKYKESFMDETSKDTESELVNEAQNVNVPASKEPFQIRQEIEVDSDILTDKIKDNGASSTSCEGKSPSVEETVETEDSSDESFCHWVTNGIPTNSQVLIFKDTLIKSVTEYIRSIIDFCYCLASKGPVQIQKEIEVYSDILTDKIKDNGASSTSCEGKSPSVEETVETEDSSDESFCHWVTNGIPTNSQVLIFKDELIKRVTEYIRSIIDFCYCLASKGPVQIQKEIEVYSDILTDKIKDNGASSTSCEGKSPSVEETVETEDSSDESFCHWVTNGIPTNSQVLIFKDELIKRVTEYIRSIIDFCYCLASKGPVQIQKEIEVYSDILTDKIKDNGASSTSCEGKSPSVEETVETEDSSDESFCHWVTNGIPTNSQVLIFKDELIKRVTEYIRSIIDFCYCLASKGPVQIQKEIEVYSDILTDKIKDNGASSTSCEGKSPSVEETVETEDSSDESFCHWVTNGIPTNSQVLIFKDTLIKSVTEYIRSIKDFCNCLASKGPLSPKRN